MIDSLEKIAEDKFLPWRATDYIDQYIDDLNDVIDGKVAPLVRDKKKMEQLVRFENNLYKTLRPIAKLEIKSQSICPVYFMSKNGRRLYAEIFGRENKAKKVKNVKREIYLNRGRLLGKKYTDSLKKKLSQARLIVNQRIRRKLLNNIDPKTGQTTIDSNDLTKSILSAKAKKKVYKLDDLLHPERFTIIINPDVANQKIKKLIALKKYFIKQLDEIDYEIDRVKHNSSRKTEKEDNELINLLEAKKLVLYIYKKKVNLLIVNTYHAAAAIDSMRRVIGKNKLKIDEKQILRYFETYDDYEQVLSQVDKFKYGASRGYSQGERNQLSHKLIDYCQGIKKKYIANEKKKIRKSEFFEKKYQVKDFVQYLEKVLDELGLSKKKDKKHGWTYTINPLRRSMAANWVKRQIICDGSFKSLYDIFAILLGHEITHVLQHHNRSKINLKILVKGVADRHQIFAEAGAKMIEDKVSQALFGIHNLPHPHYVAAMRKRLDGGTYFECVAAFYQSLIENSLGKDIDYKVFLGLALNRVMRIFRPSVVDLNSTKPNLTSSKDALYLEQLIMIDTLKKHEMEHVTMIGGLNLENLYLLAKIGIIDAKMIAGLRDSKIDERLVEVVRSCFEDYTGK